ncbi:MAG: efflux RND transporter periplasmic adaptor subunit [Desulfovibrionales bacterium]
MSIRRRILLVLVGAGIVALLVIGFLPKPMPVEVEPVTRGPLAQTIEEQGRTRIRDHYVVSSPIAAHSRRVAPEVGDTVTKGDVLVTLDPMASPALDPRSLARARARVVAAEADLASARAEHEAAKTTENYAAAEYNRLLALHGQELVSQSQVEQAETEARRAAALVRSAGFRVNTAAAGVEAAKAELEYAGQQEREFTDELVLRSPISGVVLERMFQSARVVQPGEPILVVGDPKGLEVEVDVLSADAVRIRPGMRVLLERWGPPRPLEATVLRIEPTGFTKFSALGVEEQRVLVIVGIVSPQEQWAGLGDAYRVNARFILWESDGVLRVHTSALFRHEDGWAVFVVQNGRARIVPVEVGRRAELMTQVLAGLEQGDKVIVHPDRELEDNVRVSIRDPGQGPVSR